MGRVLEYMWVTWMVIAGAGLAISVVVGYVKEKQFRLAQTAVHFLIGIAFVAAGLLQLMDVVRKEWIEAIVWTALGSVFILEGVSARPLFATIREYAGRTLTVIVGVVIVSGAVLTILVAYR